TRYPPEAGAATADTVDRKDRMTAKNFRITEMVSIFRYKCIVFNQNRYRAAFSPKENDTNTHNPRTEGMPHPHYREREATRLLPSGARNDRTGPRHDATFRQARLSNNCNTCA